MADETTQSTEQAGETNTSPATDELAKLKAENAALQEQLNAKTTADEIAKLKAQNDALKQRLASGIDAGKPEESNSLSSVFGKPDPLMPMDKIIENLKGDVGQELGYNLAKLGFDKQQIEAIQYGKNI